MATRQLVLLPSGDDGWKLDDHTKAIGRAGVAQAREALRRRTQPVDAYDHPTAA